MTPPRPPRSRGTRPHPPPRPSEEPVASARSPARPEAQPRPSTAHELKVAGRNACRALYERRPQDIRRVYITEENIPFFADTLKFCARERIAYHIKTTDDLDVVAETVHHDGVLFLARARTPATFPHVIAAAEQARARREPACFVLLEDVKNPHNLGAILRVCAHFGVRAVLAAGQTPALSPAVMRTAEGGAEHVDVVPVGDGHEALAALRARGFAVIATSSHTSEALGAHAMPERSVVLFGSEGEGLSRALLAMADVRVAIPGSGALESLNVACASSVILWELWRQHPLPSARPAAQAAPATRAASAGGPASPASGPALRGRAGAPRAQRAQRPRRPR